MPGVTPNKVYTIVAAHSGKTATVRGKGIKIEQSDWRQKRRQLWKIEAVDDGYFRIRSTASDKVMGVRGDALADGAPITQTHWRGSHNQQWSVEHIGQSRIKFTARHSGKVLSIADDSTEAGAQLVQLPWSYELGQQWLLSIATDLRINQGYDARATIYEHGNYEGREQTLGVGSYEMGELSIGNDTLSSVRVPDGLRVNLFEDAGFRGRSRSFTSDASWVGDDFNDVVSSVSVEMVVTLFENGVYAGRSQKLGVGVYDIDELRAGVGNDTVSSVKVPQGMMVSLYEHAGFVGRVRTFTESVPWVGDDFNDMASSVVVKATGLVIPNGAIKYGDTVALKSYHGTYLVAEADGRANADRAALGPWEQFRIVRSGPSTLANYVSYGDLVSLESHHGRYLVAESDGSANANREKIGGWERFRVWRTGDSLHGSFVTIGDTISLESYHGRFLVAESDGRANANREKVGGWERWRIETPTFDSGTVGACGLQTCGEAEGISYCGAQAAGVAFCGLEVCGADACDEATCSTAFSLIGACGAAAAAIAVCGADIAGLAACGADIAAVAICGIVAEGVGVCGADACAAAACAADVCGAAACPAAACGLAACFSDACVVEATAAEVCSFEAALIDTCPIDACGANVCGINLCPIDACGADACFIDLIPIIPGI